MSDGTAHVWIGRMHTDHLRRDDCDYCRAYRVRARDGDGDWRPWCYWDTAHECPRDWDPSPAERALAEVGRE